MAKKFRCSLRCFRTNRSFIAGVVAILAVARKPLLGVLGTTLIAQIIKRNAGLTAEMYNKDVHYVTAARNNGFYEEPVPHLEGDSKEVRLCKTSMYVKFAEELFAAPILTPFTDERVTLPPAERAEAYVKACLEVLENFPEEPRRILEALDPVPPPSQFHTNLTHPWLPPKFEHASVSQLEENMGINVTAKHSKETEESWWTERTKRAAELPSLEPRWKSSEELRNVNPTYLEGFRELGIWPVKDEHIEVEEIPKALAEGRTAVFDATRLCGKDIFNLTVPEIAKLHGKMAEEIPMFKLASSAVGDNSYDTLAELGKRFTDWTSFAWQNYPEYGPFAEADVLAKRNELARPQDSFYKWAVKLLSWLSWADEKEALAFVDEQLIQYRQQATQTSVNVRRLPHFPMEDMHKNMGSPSWVERLWSLLWIGPVGDFWHYDEPDNLLICVSGNLYVAVMEQNYTNLVSGTRNVGLGFNNLEGFFNFRKEGQKHWVDNNEWVKKIPIHFMKLEPGMGITVPAKAYHNVLALDGNRILINCFFLPKWGQGWYTPGKQADNYRAMWHLKTMTLGHLWDTRKVGGFFSGAKLEFF